MDPVTTTSQIPAASPTIHPGLAGIYFTETRLSHVDGQAGQLANQRRILTGNTAVDTALLAKLEKEDPTVHAILRTQIEQTDKMVGNWRTPLDSRIKDAFWAELQNALLGRKPAARALADAERRVQREIDRA